MSVTNKQETIRAKHTLVALLLGGVIAFAVLSLSFVPDETNFEASATLGTESTSIFGSLGGFPIHCSGSRDADNCLAGQKSRKAKQAVLWLGNSQVHEVNQWQPGETNGSPLLFESLGRRDLDLLTFSLGNASLQEHYVMFEYLRQRMPLKVLILPVVFDDMREEGLRSDVADFVKDSATALLLSETAIGRRLVASVQTGPKAEIASTADGTEGIADTLQDRAEKGLTGWLGAHCRLWQLRPEIRGWLFIGLYRLRNFVFGINPSTTRKVIPGRYRDNLSALNAILDRARKSHIRVVMYIAPLRGGVKIPYDPVEYAAFKSEMETLARQSGVIFKDLEKLVPDDYWGTKASTNLGEELELDFMHFRYPGHGLIAKALDELVNKAMANKKVQQ